MKKYSVILTTIAAALLLTIGQRSHSRYKPMAKIEPTTLPARWICENEVTDGTTRIGEATGTNPLATLYYDYGERQFLATIKNKIGQYIKLPKVNKQCIGGTLYRKSSDIVICRKDHTKTDNDPEDEPENFITDTGNVSDPIYWTDNEYVIIGLVRRYNSVDYRCIQDHKTQNTPPESPGFWE